MARAVLLDQQANEANATFISKLTAMFTELYNSFGGATNPSVATVTASGLVTAGSAKVDTGTKTATAASGAATLNKNAGAVTSEVSLHGCGRDLHVDPHKFNHCCGGSGHG